MSTYKAIISDFDGTLCGPDFKISEEVKAAIAKWRKSGRHFSIATGKAFAGIIEKATAELGLTDPIIVSSGAQIMQPQTQEVLVAEYIGKEDVQQIRNILDKTEILYEIQTSTAVYASNPILHDMQKHKKYTDITDFLSQDVLFIRLVTTNQDQGKVNTFVDTAITQRFSQLSVIQSNTPYSLGINITAKNATKQIAIERLAHVLHLTSSEIIGIGDGLNDYPLLMACGYKVAMGNAPEELKAVADEVISDYEHNGVAGFINKQLHK